MKPWIRQMQFFTGAILALLLLLVVQTPAHAGNALYMNPDQTPVVWDNREAIPYMIDGKGFGTLSPDESQALVQRALAVWQNVAGANLKFQYLGTTEAITPSNWKSIAGHSLYHQSQTSSLSSPAVAQKQGILIIAFDNDGLIIEEKGSGLASGISSITAVSGTPQEPGHIKSAQVFLNGLYFGGASNVEDLTLQDMFAVLVHEVGHALGLDHSVIDHQLYRDILNQKADPALARYLPTMFPRFIKGSGSYMTTLHPDDMATLRWLYGTIQPPQVVGEVRDSKGDLRPGAVVTMRRADSPLCQSFSQVAGNPCGRRVDPNTQTPIFYNGHCEDLTAAAAYRLPVASAGAYSLDVQELPADFSEALLRHDDFLNQALLDGAQFYSMVPLNELQQAPAEILLDHEELPLDFELIAQDQIYKRISYDFFLAQQGVDAACDRSFVLKESDLQSVSLSTNTLNEVGSNGFNAASGCSLQTRPSSSSPKRLQGMMLLMGLGLALPLNIRRTLKSKL